ncbi:tRNA1(Val) (adenine(37)-N6)-methyltransferase [Roseivirga misakiensis]|uniref:tRNA1(Val) (adenine(37)-N6)-methyltransferase n=1 Tax=Roseivirga misakiensis TaxID=1563681 RepID=A0A1E5SY93_9BACT|nr:methyltransferase [Roseivirga misakiensis]OEK04086.1 hypothetical protein BFP71_11390 [Roseivirga misakiensis]
MANTYFQFKQFRIEQDKAGMKVTTDGCLFGALIQPVPTGTILDVGTGTGLLSLMLAQKTSAQIEAIEIDESVAEQASHNFRTSPWAGQLKVHTTSLQAFNPSRKFDQIVCNPPFFKGNALGKSKVKNQAVHDHTLPMEILLKRCNDLLHDQGSLWLMYPPYEMSLFKEMALKVGFMEANSISIKNTEGTSAIRVVTAFSKKKESVKKDSSIVIKKADQQYTPEFIELLKPFYLHL